MFTSFGKPLEDDLFFLRYWTVTWAHFTALFKVPKSSLPESKVELVNVKVCDGEEQIHS